MLKQLIEADTAIEGTKYREVEAEVELSNFALLLDIAYAQADTYVVTFSEAIRSTSTQITVYGQQFFSDSRQVLQVAFALVTFMIVLTLATETGTVLPRASINCFTMRQIVSKHTKYDGSHFTQTTSLQDIYLPAHSQKKLVAYMQRLRQAAREGLPLPSLVVCEPPGVGKTLVAAVSTLDGQRSKQQSPSSFSRETDENEIHDKNRNKN